MFKTCSKLSKVNNGNAFTLCVAKTTQLPKTKAPEPKATNNEKRTKRNKTDKNAVRSCYALIQTNNVSYIIFIIAIYRIDTKYR